MKVLTITFLVLGLNCSSINLPPKECGEYGYSHFVNFPQVERYAERCSYAYKSNKEIKKRYSYYNVFIKTLKSVDVKYFIYYEHMQNRQNIVIRGTSNLKNAKIDGSYRKILNNKLSNYYSSKIIDQEKILDPKLKVYVHKGFNETATAIYRDIIRNNRLERRYRTTITGHSLGGAAALLLYLYLYVDSMKLGTLYTFGQPKVLAADGVMKYRCIPCIRFINENDLVPLIPPSRWALGLITSLPLWCHGLYRHLGDEVILLKDSNYVYLEYHDAERLDVSSFWKSLDKNEISIKDHDIKSYLNNLKIKKSVITERDYKNRKKFQ